ncbi:glycosyltransferase family 1 protein [bacterium]|nr:MAG: glycosyltransferase family 1 protein [bacterium]
MDYNEEVLTCFMCSMFHVPCSMIIISAKNAFLKQRTGVEEYTFQLLKHLANFSIKEEIIVFTNKIEEKIDFPGNFHLKIIKLPFLWTQIGLSWEIFKIRITNYELRIKGKIGFNCQKPVAIKLFVPIHVMPLIHPRHTVVTVHGLECEYFPEYYGWFSRKYLRWSTRYATKHAWKIIAVSENTKCDLVKLYKADPRKIEVIYHGVTINQKSKIKDQNDNKKFKNKKPYFLYLGRIELKKNILGIIRAFEMFKQIQDSRFKIQEGKADQLPNDNKIASSFPAVISRNDAPIVIARSEATKQSEGGDNMDISDYKLILAGGKGYGWEIVKCLLSRQGSSQSEGSSTYNMKHKKDIIFMGYVDEKKKWELLKNAEALVFPSFYEGFGMPILEAQSMGTPVITSDNSSMGEITDLKFSIFNSFVNEIHFQFSKKSKRKNDNVKFKKPASSIQLPDSVSALLVNPNKPEEIAEAMQRIVSDKKLRDELIKRGYSNVKRFSWEKCAEKTLQVLKK